MRERKIERERETVRGRGNRENAQRGTGRTDSVEGDAGKSRNAPTSQRADTHGHFPYDQNGLWVLVSPIRGRAAARSRCEGPAGLCACARRAPPAVGRTRGGRNDR